MIFVGRYCLKGLKVFHGDLSLKNFGSAFNVHSCVGSKIIKF